jgi:hypothetical protein
VASSAASRGPGPRCAAGRATPLDPASDFLGAQSHGLSMQLILNDEFHSADVLIFPPGTSNPVRHPAPFRLADKIAAVAGPAPPSSLFVLPDVVERIQTIAPWLTTIVSPILLDADLPEGFEVGQYALSKDSKSRYARISGVSIDDKELIALSLCFSSWSLLSTAYHEVWHAVETKIDTDLLLDIDREMSPLDFGTSYFNAPWERRARAFETWCMRFQEGLPAIQITSATDEIFNHVATGGFANEWKQHQDVTLKSLRSEKSRAERSSITSRSIPVLPPQIRSNTIPPKLD